MSPAALSDGSATRGTFDILAHMAVDALEMLSHLLGCTIGITARRKRTRRSLDG